MQIEQIPDVADVADVGLAAVMLRIDTMETEIHRLDESLRLLCLEISGDQEGGARDDRAKLSTAVAIAHEDAGFNQAQAISALHRISDKLSAIATMLIQVGAIAPAEDLNKTPAYIRRPRKVPEIKRSKRGKVRLIQQVK